MITLTLRDCKIPSQKHTIDLSPNTLSLTRLKLIAFKKFDINLTKNHSTSPQYKLYKESGQEITNVSSISHGDNIYLSDGQIYDGIEDEVWHVSVLGSLRGVGKSALTLRFIQGQFVPDYDPTIEDAYRKYINVDGNKLLIDVLDTARDEDFIQLLTSWMRNKDGYILTFSINDRQSYEELHDIYDQLYEVYEGDIPPTILVGTKCDLVSSNITDVNQISMIIAYWCHEHVLIPMDIVNIIVMNIEVSMERKITVDEAERLVEKWDLVRYIETSAKTGYNVDNAFGIIAREIIALQIALQVPDGRNCHCVLL